MLEDYPDVTLGDVYRISDGILLPHHKNKLQDVDFDKPGTLQLVKKMSIDEKIAHWQRVFQYAEDRGIEIYLFCWNLFTWYADGKYGINQQQDNPQTIEYTRKADRPTPQPTPWRFHTVLKNGQLVVYRGTPENPDVILWQSSKVSGPGPYKLGITVSKRLVIFSEFGDKRKIIWRSPAQN